MLGVPLYCRGLAVGVLGSPVLLNLGSPILLGVPLYCLGSPCIAGEGVNVCVGQLCGAGLWVTAAPRAEWGPQGHGRERAWLW